MPASFFEVQVCEGTVGGYALETATRDDAVDFGPAFLSAQYLLPPSSIGTSPSPPLGTAPPRSARVRVRVKVKERAADSAASRGDDHVQQRNR